MAITVGSDRMRSVFGDRRVLALDITGDTAYPTGGYSITPALVGMTRFDAVKVQQPKTATRIVTWDYANSKLMIYTALSTEAANASDQSSVVVTVEFIGE